MVTKREFNGIKRENPESRIGKRNWEEQSMRNELAKTLRKEENDVEYTLKDGEYTCEAAKALIKGGNISLLIDNLEKFEGLDEKVAKELIKKGFGGYILINEKCFSINNSLVENEIGLDYVLKNIKKIDGKYHDDLLIKLIEKGIWRKYFRTDNNKIGEVLKRFEISDYSKVAMKLDVKDLIKSITSFKNLNKDVALKLIDSGYRFSRKFNNDFQKNGYFPLAYFDGLDNEVLSKLVEQDCAILSNIPRFLGNFKGLDKNGLLKIARLSPDDRPIYNIMKHKDSFEGVNFDKDLAYELLAIDPNGVIQNSDKFEGFELNKDVAMKLVENKDSRYLLFYIKKFKDLDREVAEKIIVEDKGDSDGHYRCENIERVLQNKSKFKGLEFDDKLFDLLIKANYVVRWMHKFPNVDEEQVINRLTERKEGFFDIFGTWLDHNFPAELKGCQFNIKKIKNHNLVLKKMVDFNYLPWNLLGNLKDLNKESAMYLLDKGYGNIFVKLIEKFKGLDGEVAKKLSEIGYGDFVSKHPKKFGLKKEK